MKKKLKTRIIIISTVLASLVATSVGVSIWSEVELGKMIEQQTLASSALRRHQDADMMHDAIRGDVLAALQASATADTRTLNEVSDALKEHSQSMKDSIGKNLSEEKLPVGIKEALKAISDPMLSYINQAESVVRKAKSSSAEGNAAFPQFSAQFEVVEEKAGKASGLIEAWVSESQKQVAEFRELVSRLIMGFAVIVLLGVIVVPILIINLVFKPLKVISDSISKVAEGDMEVTIPEVKNQEIGAIAENLGQIMEMGAKSTRIQTSLDSVTSSVMLADENNVVIYMNPSVMKVLKEAEGDIQKDLPNFRVDKIIGTNIDDFHKKPEHQRSLLKDLKGTYNTSITLGGRIFDLVANPVFDKNRKRLGTVVEWQDVTKKRELDKILEDCQGQVNALNRSQASIEFNLDGTIIKANKHFLNAMGYTLEEIQGKHHSIFADPEYAKSEEYKEFWDDLRDGKFKADQYIRFGKGGKEVWIQATYNPIIGMDGKPFKVVKYAVDVTHRREETLRSARVQTSLDCVSSSVMMADENNVVIYMNPAVIKTLKAAEADIQKQLPNFNANKIVGSNIDVFHKNPEHQRGMLAKLKSTYSTNITVGGRIFDLVANPVFGPKGERLGTVVEWQDVTVQKGIERDINNIIDAVAKGDFNQRLDASDKSGFFKNLSEGINRICEVSLIGLTEVVNVLKTVSEGDLTKKVEGDYQGLFDEIKQSLNGTVERLFDTVKSIKESASAVNSAASEISAGSADLSQRTEAQASSLEETAASMEEITATVKQNSENAKKASDLSGNAKGIASRGGEVAQNAVQAMGRISESSQKISDIIGVIDDIAFQTNLLALNAAVEAARAGEAGKGFAVVASEVRSLAGRSASASKEIKTLINESVDEVKSGSDLVNQAGQTLQEIVKAVQDVATLMGEIASASEEQSTGIDEINSAVMQMDEGTQQNAALVEENTAAAQSLVDQAEGLDEMMKFFNIGEAAEEARGPRKPLALEAPEPKPAAKTAASAKKPTAGAKKQTAKPAASASKKPGNGKKMPVAVVEGKFDEGWEEF